MMHYSNHSMMSENDEIYMQRCLALAEKGRGFTRSNPMVGAVLVKEGHIISEGFHRAFGEPHAEVNALNNVENPALIPECRLFVNLEPCSHHGKTPPCADFIINSGIKDVTIGTLDPNPQVAGTGIARLRMAGLNVKCGILQQPCRELNKRFFTFHEKKRPWIMLKWAESRDHFIAREDGKQLWISSEDSRALVHRWRAEEMAILVGTRTALSDNPKLSARTGNSIQPVRIVIDRKLSLPGNLNIFDGSQKTLIFTENKKIINYPATEIIQISFSESLLHGICDELYRRNIISCMIEGGTKTINHWIESNLWDEARVFSSPAVLGTGIRAPAINKQTDKLEQSGTDTILYYSNYPKD